MYTVEILLDCSWLKLFKFTKSMDIEIARLFVCLFSENLKQLIASSKECGITFYYALSPGLDISFSSSRDIHLLQRKMDQVWYIYNYRFKATCVQPSVVTEQFLKLVAHWLTTFMNSNCGRQEEPTA